MRLEHTAPMALVAAAMAAGAAHAQVLTQTVSASNTISVDADATYDMDLFIDKFDTMGGTRELVGIDIHYTDEITGTMSWGDNPFPDEFVGTSFYTGYTWEGNLDGVLIPYNETGGSGHNIDVGIGWGEQILPGGGGDSIAVGAGGGHSDLGMNPIDDASLFSVLTGAGQAHIDGTALIEAIEETQLLGPLHDIVVPDHIFVQGLFQLELHELMIGISIDYHYVNVPTPGAVGAMAMCGIGLGVRRRRR